MRSLEYSIDHICLPPKTRQKDDASIAEEHNLINFLLQSTTYFSEQYSATEAEQLEPVTRMLQRLLKTKPGLESSAKQSAVKEAIRELDNGGMFPSLLWRFCAQMRNRGVATGDKLPAHLYPVPF